MHGKEVKMKKKIQNICSVFFLLFAISAFAVTAKADTAGNLLVDGSNVIVSLHLSEGKTETITSLRFKMYIKVKSGEIKNPSFQFADGFTSEVKDAAVSQTEDGTYLMDIILSGKQKQDIFQGKEDAVIGTLLLKQQEGKGFVAEVGFAGEDTSEEEGVQPVVQYVDSSGISMETLPFDNAAPVISSYKQPEKEQPTAEETTSTTGQKEETKPGVQKVTGVTAVYKNTSKVAVSWKKVAGAYGYEIYRSKKENGRYTLKERVTATGQKEKVKLNHKDGKTFYYKVRAYTKNADGTNVYGEFSEAILAAPAKPKVKADVNYSLKKVTLKWEKADRADGYVVYKYNVKKNKYKKLATVTKTTSWSKTLRSGKKYVLRVRAYEKDAKGKKNYGALSASKVVRVK